MSDGWNALRIRAQFACGRSDKTEAMPARRLGATRLFRGAVGSKALIGAHSRLMPAVHATIVRMTNSAVAKRPVNGAAAAPYGAPSSLCARSSPLSAPPI